MVLLPILDIDRNSADSSTAESQRDVLENFYSIVSEFYDRIMTNYGKKKIKGREQVKIQCKH